jgi:uncharacterized cupredoxin-like copper-binding protein
VRTPIRFVSWSVLATLAGGAGRATAQTPPPAARELVVTAGDFHFRAPRAVPAGRTRVRVRNTGTQPHHVQLVRLDAGHTMGELIDSIGRRSFQLPWARYVGGPEAPAPGEAMDVTLTLTPGEYVMICVVSGADHVPHVAKGMALPLTVTPSPAADLAEDSAADVRIELSEFAFGIVPAIRVGRRTIRVVNAGRLVHHVSVERLAPGRTAAELLAWFRTMQGPPPGEPVGGTTVLSPGMANGFTADFTPGEYVLICFVPDERDGKSHAAHGMVRQIRVQ